MNWIEILLTGLKILFLIWFGIYFLFALVVLRQTFMMTKVVSSPLNIPLKIFAWFHLFVATLIFIAALVLL